jgi:hypothetical protein
MLGIQNRCREFTDMPAEVSRRDFLRGAEGIVLAAALNRAYAGVSPEDLAGDESFWNKIRSAYVRDPKILNLNNWRGCPNSYRRPRRRCFGAAKWRQRESGFRTGAVYSPANAEWDPTEVQRLDFRRGGARTYQRNHDAA